ncbi:hypothetical protein [Peribacillus asahii]|uniref:hypothetical protein n=1 Tax=Peribacillus asahii TaxID=228899 RepID=UPI0020799696|nr:hypothetical protein [Peribacillus asahii]USK86146.1 hypothetical protein LIT35_05760 [Peribacillus asahii]
MRESNKATSFFIDKYVEIINIKNEPDIRKKFRDDCLRLNRILKRENLRIDLNGNTIIINEVTTEARKINEAKSDEEREELPDTKISNFCVIPTHRLYVKNEEGIYENGIGVKVFVRISKNKFKCIYLNLTTDMIEKGHWVTPAYLDHDLYLYNKSLYSQLRIAVKISTRALSSDEFKIFDGEWWLENQYDDVEISDFEGFHDSNSIAMLAHPSITNGAIKSIHYDRAGGENNERTDSIIKQDILRFLQAINELVKKEVVLDIGVKPDNHENIGWKDKDKYYLLYRRTWDWIVDLLKETNYQISIPEKELDIQLHKEEIIEIEEEKRTGRKRADCNTTVYPKKKERVFKISIARLNEFIDTYNDLVNP